MHYVHQFLLSNIISHFGVALQVYKSKILRLKRIQERTPCRLLDTGFRMRFQNKPYCIILLFLVNIRKNEGLLFHGNSLTSNNTIHGHLGENVDIAGIIQMLSNMTADQKQQTAEIENLKQQAENDRSTIQVLQNRVFLLESELNKLPSTQEFSTYLSGMNQLTHSLVKNEASDRNLTQRLNKALEIILQNNISASQEFRNQSRELEMLRQKSKEDRSTIQQLNGSLSQEIRTIKERIASMYSLRLSINVTIMITSGNICFYSI